MKEYRFEQHDVHKHCNVQSLLWFHAIYDVHLPPRQYSSTVAFRRARPARHRRRICATMSGWVRWHDSAFYLNQLGWWRVLSHKSTCSRPLGIVWISWKTNKEKYPDS